MGSRVILIPYAPDGDVGGECRQTRAGQDVGSGGEYPMRYAEGLGWEMSCLCWGLTNLFEGSKADFLFGARLRSVGESRFQWTLQ